MRTVNISFFQKMENAINVIQTRYQKKRMEEKNVTEICWHRLVSKFLSRVNQSYKTCSHSFKDYCNISIIWNLQELVKEKICNILYRQLTLKSWCAMLINNRFVYINIKFLLGSINLSIKLIFYTRKGKHFNATLEIVRIFILMSNKKK